MNVVGLGRLDVHRLGDGILGSLLLSIWRMLDGLFLYRNNFCFHYMLRGIVVRKVIDMCGLVYARVVSIGQE